MTFEHAMRAPVIEKSIFLIIRRRHYNSMCFGLFWSLYQKHKHRGFTFNTGKRHVLVAFYTCYLKIAWKNSNWWQLFVVPKQSTICRAFDIYFLSHKFVAGLRLQFFTSACTEYFILSLWICRLRENSPNMVKFHTFHRSPHVTRSAPWQRRISGIELDLPCLYCHITVDSFSRTACTTSTAEWSQFGRCAHHMDCNSVQTWLRYLCLWHDMK